MTPTPGILWRWPDGRTHRLSEYEVRVGTCALPGPNSRPDMRVVSDGSPDPTDPLTRLWLDAQAPSADEVGRAARITLDLGAPARAEGLDEARAALAYADTYASGVLNGPPHGGELYPRELLARTVGVDRDHLRHALTVTDQLAGEVARLRAELAEARRERANLATTLYREGYTPCSVPACNCGSWHGGHIAELRARLRHTAQLLIAEIGAGGPMDAEAAAEKAVATIIGLRAEFAEARKVAPRWVRSEDVGETPEEWRLTIGGRLCVPDAKIVRPAGMPPVVWILGRSFGTLHEAARAVCTRLGLPLITEGLEVGRG